MIVKFTQCIRKKYNYITLKACLTITKINVQYFILFILFLSIRNNYLCLFRVENNVLYLIAITLLKYDFDMIFSL